MQNDMLLSDGWPVGVGGVGWGWGEDTDGWEERGGWELIKG